MNAQIAVCLSCTQPPDRCDNVGKGRPCPYTQQFGRQKPPPVLMQHFAGRREPVAEKLGHEAIYRAAMKLEREMERNLKQMRRAL